MDVNVTICEMWLLLCEKAEHMAENGWMNKGWKESQRRNLQIEWKRHQNNPSKSDSFVSSTSTWTNPAHKCMSKYHKRKPKHSPRWRRFSGLRWPSSRCGWLSLRISVSRRLFSELSDGDRMAADRAGLRFWATLLSSCAVSVSTWSAGLRTNSWPFTESLITDVCAWRGGHQSKTLAARTENVLHWSTPHTRKYITHDKLESKTLVFVYVVLAYSSSTLWLKLESLANCNHPPLTLLRTLLLIAKYINTL